MISEATKNASEVVARVRWISAWSLYRLTVGSRSLDYLRIGPRRDMTQTPRPLAPRDRGRGV
jgi:hypothetical protein